jgi:hypothetical protein
LKSNHDLAHQRLHTQFITRPNFEKPGDVVKWFGAVQAQDYLGALWAVGLRMQNATEADVEQAIADRAIVRTWPMRGTIHFVAPEDVKWLVKLLALRGGALRGKWLYDNFGLDEAEFARSRDALVKAMHGGKPLQRRNTYKVLEDAGIATADQRGLHIVGHLAREGLICFGPREGKQPTFVLLDEWVPQARDLERDEALAEVSRRYFTSHGPATLQDFAWWSGLPARDARAGLEMVRSELAQEVVDGKTYWLSPSTRTAEEPPPTAHLLPAYDEYTVAYTDRSAVLDHAHDAEARGGVLNPVIVVDGQVVGLWKRAYQKESVAITLQPFRKLSDAEHQAIAEAVNRFGRFLNMPVCVS